MLIQKLTCLAISAGVHARGFELLGEHRAEQVDAEEADAPQADHAGKGHAHADDRVAPPARIAEQLPRTSPVALRVVPRRSPRLASARALSSGGESKSPTGPAPCPRTNITRQACTG